MITKLIKVGNAQKGGLALSTLEWIASIVLAISCVSLIVVVLLQQGAQQGLSGAISGGAETFFGKNKARGMQSFLSKMTIVFACVFVLAVLVINIF